MGRQIRRSWLKFYGFILGLMVTLGVRSSHADTVICPGPCNTECNPGYDGGPDGDNEHMTRYEICGEYSGAKIACCNIYHYRDFYKSQTVFAVVGCENPEHYLVNEDIYHSIASKHPDCDENKENCVLDGRLTLEYLQSGMAHGDLRSGGYPYRPGSPNDSPLVYCRACPSVGPFTTENGEKYLETKLQYPLNEPERGLKIRDCRVKETVFMQDTNGTFTLLGNTSRPGENVTGCWSGHS